MSRPKKILVPIGPLPDIPLLLAREVAAVFGISRPLVYRLVRARRLLPPEMLGDTRYWRRERLAAWIEEGEGCGDAQRRLV